MGLGAQLHQTETQHPAIGHFHRHDYESMSRDVDDATEQMSGVPPEYRLATELVTAELQVKLHAVRQLTRAE